MIHTMSDDSAAKAHFVVTIRSTAQKKWIEENCTSAVPLYHKGTVGTQWVLIRDPTEQALYTLQWGEI